VSRRVQEHCSIPRAGSAPDHLCGSHALSRWDPDLKAQGCDFEPTHVNPMIALRTAVCCERWDEAWQDTLDE